MLITKVIFVIELRSIQIEINWTDFSPNLHVFSKIKTHPICFRSIREKLGQHIIRRKVFEVESPEVLLLRSENKFGPEPQFRNIIGPACSRE